MSDDEIEEFKIKIEENYDKIISAVFKINEIIEATLYDKNKEFEIKNRF